MADRTTIKNVHFLNYKSFADFSLAIRHLNVLVGPNNCGKSTILSAFRVLSTGISLARARKPQVVDGPESEKPGYHVGTRDLPFSFENVHTDLADTDTKVRFELTNGTEITLFFPKDGGCRMFCHQDGVVPHTPTKFKRICPLTINHIPVLGPVDYEEERVEETTVKRGLNSHRASSHFRNYWYYNQSGFADFAKLLRETWPEMGISLPEREYLPGKAVLFMTCTENRMARELYWAGFGFQVWCQLLTHLSRSRDTDVLVVDEPEIYLHPDLQRQLLHLLREAGPDIVLATHSSEIVNEAEPNDIVLIDKKERRSKRIKGAAQVQSALDVLGSNQNVTLTQLARNRRIVFVEGKDFQLLRMFARKLGSRDLATGMGITILPIRGFTSWSRLKAIAWAFEKALGQRITLSAIFDRDFRSSEETEAIAQEIERHIEFVHFHSRKEIENYLLIPDALDRAVQGLVAERARRTNTEIPALPSIEELLERVTKPMRNKAQGQYVARRQEYLQKTRADPATIASETMSWFGDEWDDIDRRMAIIPGKDCLSALNRELQSEFSITLPRSRIIGAMRVDDVPADLCRLVEHLELFRKAELRAEVFEG